MEGQLCSLVALPTGETVPSTHWFGSWVDPRAVKKNKHFCPWEDSNPAFQLVARRFTERAIPASHSEYSWNNFKDDFIYGIYGKKKFTH
jgi:hypothetical protein